MENKLKEYLDRLFSGVSDKKALEIKEEILQNTLDKYNDLLDEGKSEEEAFKLATDAIGDISLILKSEQITSCGSIYTEEAIHSFDIHWLSGSVQIKAYDGDKTEVSEIGYESDDERMVCSVEGGILKVKYVKDSMQHAKNLPEKHLAVKLPTAYAKALRSVKVDCVSSDVNVSGITSDELELKTVNGQIEISSVKADSLNALSTSGDVSMKDSCAEEINTCTVSGDIEISSVKTDSLKACSTSGDVDLKAASAKEIKVQTVSGDTNVSSGKADSIYAKSTSGDLELRSDMRIIESSSSSGDINVFSAELEDARLNTSSGDITLNLPSECGFTATLSTISGDKNIDFASTLSEKKYIHGDGKTKLTLSSINGDINIRQSK